METELSCKKRKSSLCAGTHWNFNNNISVGELVIDSKVLDDIMHIGEKYVNNRHQMIPGVIKVKDVCVQVFADYGWFLELSVAY